ncbi:hypothetical protein NIES2100_20230 [Calothrix sp. NIES-2100]|nr:hypothetical protein NIES2100_20230 [Calothrix sp. NIES-2100]
MKILASLSQSIDPRLFGKVGDLRESERLFEKWLAVILGTNRSPLAPLKKGGKLLKVPLFKGDLGGSKTFCYPRQDFSNIL